ncbi:hypothetical protein [Burkholderia plantarii]|uniref:Lipoprotein n=1 Tax=Burkholderia plantarii TaxID=41899 RepID=A0A0B6RYG1_BURPL|nr:hypothetical protein [Burkholderia plantarii]AJK50367.1 hypothetical protein BGL_2c23080 [Burkholderia plantarii]ALK34540.1 hypothetical protein bpln_2g23340 [Burkholderia plantarii]WLE63570.1 hypothetical protein GIY62_25130 [Burkholderia plantarii]GLZ22689.1 hypothetical protein Bpla01_62180 [Burkholderia plantarii]
MKQSIAAACAAALTLTALPALADAPAIAATPGEPCAIGYVTGVAGSPQSLREYLASPEKDRFRYLTGNPLQCKVSDEGRVSACVGVTSLRHERVSVYDDSGSTTTSVVARIEIDQGTFPIIVDVRKQDLSCEK